MKARWMLAVALVGLVGCTAAPVRQRDDVALLAKQQQRETSLRSVSDWSFRGKLAVSQAGNGGSGSIEWHQRDEDFDIRLAAPITRQSWRLTRSAGQVRLEGIEGGTRVGVDAEALLQEATGWRIPVQAMADWVRGARTEGVAEIDFTEDGLPGTLAQQGWSIEFRAWDGSSPPRPLKVYARSGDASVRLVIDAWATP